jgi:stage II sporulation protein R
LRGAAALATVLFLASVCSFQARCAGIRREVLRLHVVANSESDLDQQAKLAVRDAILAQGATLFDGSVDAVHAQSAIAPHAAELEACARRVLRQYGLTYGVRVVEEEAYFNTRTYEETGVTLPAGRYQAVRVLLGAAGGQNWWCVMFPPLCLPAAEPRKSAATLDALLTNGQLRVVKSNPRYEIRFKVVELWECFLDRLWR